jgi:hypothetical protein
LEQQLELFSKIKIDDSKFRVNVTPTKREKKLRV